MCINIWADHPITIDLLQEALFPEVDNQYGHVGTFLQCYDLLVRNHGPTAIERLMVLHPRTLIGGTRSLIRSGTGIDAWVREHPIQSGLVYPHGAPRIDSKKGVAAVPVEHVRTSPQDLVRARVSRVKAVHRHPVLTDDVARALYEGDEQFPTPIVIELDPPIAPTTPAGEPHFIQIALKPSVVRAVALEALQLHSTGRSALLKQTFKVRSADLNAHFFHDRLEEIEREIGPAAVAAKRVREEVFAKGIRSAQRTSRLGELRVAVVTGRETMLLGHNSTGAINFVEVRELDEPAQVAKRCAHVWLAGAKHYRQYDSVTLATQLAFAIKMAGRPVLLEDAAMAAGIVELNQARLFAKALDAAGFIAREGTSMEHGHAWAAAPALKGLAVEELRRERFELALRVALSRAANGSELVWTLHTPDITFSILTERREI